MSVPQVIMPDTIYLQFFRVVAFVMDAEWCRLHTGIIPSSIFCARMLHMLHGLSFRGFDSSEQFGLI